MKVLALRLAYQLLRLYWQVFHPKVFGVKAVVVRKDDPNELLLVRHSYGNKKLWSIPGGGYNPNKETPEDAIQREIMEELGCKPISLVLMGEYFTEEEGKKDTVKMFLATIEDLGSNTDAEIAERRWHAIDSIESIENVARVARTGVQQYKEKLQGLPIALK